MTTFGRSPLYKDWICHYLLMAMILVLSGCAQAQTESNQISVADLKNKLDSKHPGILLDVRSQAEIDKGTIPGFKQFITYGSADFPDKIKALDKSKTYYVYCHSGARSQKTISEMKRLGFLHVYNVAGGVVAWKQNGYKLK